MGQRFQGNVPQDEGWVMEAQLDQNWRLYTRLADDGWIQCKVVAVTPTEDKANYWFSWRANGCVAKARDLFIMKERRGWLWEAALAELEKAYG